MNEQTSLWQGDYQSADFAELCNALYEREDDEPAEKMNFDSM